MGQFPPQPLNYMGSPPVAPQLRQPSFARRSFGWILFIGLAIMMFMLLSTKGGTAYPAIPLNEFADQLKRQQVVSVTVEGDEITGALRTPLNLPNGTRVMQFRTALPPGATGDWKFMQWLLETGQGSTRIDVRGANNYVVNILLPLIPWLLIFGFIWFFVFRNLRKTQQATRFVISGPGRWVPDEPGKAGPP
jgi:ATP-dependent Zn protease